MSPTISSNKHSRSWLGFEQSDQHIVSVPERVVLYVSLITGFVKSLAMLLVVWLFPRLTPQIPKADRHLRQAEARILGGHKRHRDHVRGGDAGNRSSPTSGRRPALRRVDFDGSPTTRPNFHARSRSAQHVPTLRNRGHKQAASMSRATTVAPIGKMDAILATVTMCVQETIRGNYGKSFDTADTSEAEHAPSDVTTASEFSDTSESSVTSDLNVASEPKVNYAITGTSEDTSDSGGVIFTDPFVKASKRVTRPKITKQPAVQSFRDRRHSAGKETALSDTASVGDRPRKLSAGKASAGNKPSAMSVFNASVASAMNSPVKAAKVSLASAGKASLALANKASLPTMNKATLATAGKASLATANKATLKLANLAKPQRPGPSSLSPPTKPTATATPDAAANPTAPSLQLVPTTPKLVSRVNRTPVPPTLSTVLRTGISDFGLCLLPSEGGGHRSSI
ncbi:hypothetical protein BD626DRAFT_512062 [Schizophyllum amplum]|uniref:Uncharacterized protein n=1 Tax=Schizophyllum amplum TaxID=97359 RepID=A0A550C0G5_9AGAR|nr:hypothetical protein BD626DRAFT_512062 [Auriculariopsis ampla]